APYAAAIVLAASTGWFGLRLGTERTTNVHLIVPSVPAPNMGSTVDPGAVFSKERESLSAQIDERNRAIARLTDKVARQTATVEKLQQEQQDLNGSLQKAQSERDQRVSEREALSRSLDQSQAALAQAKKDLEVLQKQRADEAPHEAEVEARLAK